MITTMIKLLGDKSLRALMFVQTLNAQGIEPTVSDAGAFVEARQFNDFDPLSEGYFRATVDYLLDARLLFKTRGTKKLTLSPAGQAILRASDPQDVAQGPTAPVEVVGHMNDPVVYAELLTRIDDVGTDSERFRYNSHFSRPGTFMVKRMIFAPAESLPLSNDVISTLPVTLVPTLGFSTPSWPCAVAVSAVSPVLQTKRRTSGATEVPSERMAQVAGSNSCPDTAFVVDGEGSSGVDKSLQPVRNMSETAVSAARA